MKSLLVSVAILFTAGFANAQGTDLNLLCTNNNLGDNSVEVSLMDIYGGQTILRVVESGQVVGLDYTFATSVVETPTMIESKLFESVRNDGAEFSVDFITKNSDGSHPAWVLYPAKYGEMVSVSLTCIQQ